MPLSWLKSLAEQDATEQASGAVVQERSRKLLSKIGRPQPFLSRSSGGWHTLVPTGGQKEFFSQKSIHGRFLQLDNFLRQNRAIQRNAARIRLLGPASEKQTAQRGEKMRKKSLGNYKSAAYQLSYAGILRPERPPSAAISLLTAYAIFYGMPVGAMSTGKEQTKLKTSSPMCFAEHRRTTCCTNWIRCDGFVG
jgi:hypothetical protein